jgi:DNA-binding CsgD family transcriptional regulator
MSAECLPLAYALEDPLGLTMAFEVLAWVGAAAGRHHRAARLLGASAKHAQVNGGSPYDAGLFRPVRDRYESAARTNLGVAEFQAEFARGYALGAGAAVAYALGDTSSPETPAAAGETSGLTQRELEVAELVAGGLSNKQIADQLAISKRTAECHIARILVKLGFTSRTQLAVWHATDSEAASTGPAAR